ncbi:Olfactory receptor 5B3 [Lemmus lemmus]
MENRTGVTQFILMGITNDPNLQFPLFIIFLLIYAITLVGNLGMFMLILLDSRLHTPMYIFLCNLSFVDFCYSSTITPKVIVGFLTGDKIMSYNACASQMFFFATFADLENYFLVSMAYDRYVAVCKPLHYATTMTTSVCTCLIIGCYICGFLNASIYTVDALSLSFCESNVVHHFFCDVLAVMILSCSDRHVNELVLIYLASFNIFFALILILISYMFIFINILKMDSVAGYRKALSTCTSHFTAVSIFYDKISSVFYTMVIPMLNPLVYSLRNKEVKSAFTKILLKSK